MKKLIAIAMLTTFALTGLALADEMDDKAIEKCVKEGMDNRNAFERGVDYLVSNMERAREGAIREDCKYERYVEIRDNKGDKGDRGDKGDKGSEK